MHKKHVVTDVFFVQSVKIRLARRPKKFYYNSTGGKKWVIKPYKW